MKRQLGFTLIEMMVTVAIIGILTAIAVPAYSNYVTRARVGEAFTALSNAQLQAEQYWANKRTYKDLPAPDDTANFTYVVSGTSDSAYTVTANGVTPGKMSEFSYTINQSGTRATTNLPTGWTKSTTCWVDRKGGLCTQ